MVVVPAFFALTPGPSPASGRGEKIFRVRTDYNLSLQNFDYYSGGEICNIKHLHNFESMIIANLT